MGPSPVVEEEPHNLQPAVTDGLGERSVAVMVDTVDVNPGGLQTLLQSPDVPFPGCNVESRLSMRVLLVDINCLGCSRKTRLESLDFLDSDGVIPQALDTNRLLIPLSVGILMEPQRRTGTL